MTATEALHPRSLGIDTWPDETVLDALLTGQKQAIAAVGAALSALAAAAEAIAARLRDGGRIIYLGAGSSGLLAALDGMELAGTFGWPEERTIFVLANGHTIAPGMPGGREDDAERGRAEMVLHNPRPVDAVIAVTASGSTAYTLSAAAAARQAGALTVGLANNREAPLLRQVEVPVFLDSGPEIIVGSTRLGAGTAQKAALGLLSSLVMIRLGHIYDGLMVNLRADNRKLKARAITTLVHITGATAGEADDALEKAHGQVKHAALILRGKTLEEAEASLATAEGNLRTALSRLH